MTVKYFHPRYWHIWFLFGLLRVVSVTPYKIQTYLGRRMGLLAKYFMLNRKKIAVKNLKTCFPKWSSDQRSKILNLHFQNLGIALLEQGMTWWWSDKRFSSLANIEGLDNLQKALEMNKGVILLSGHFTTVEIISRVLRLHAEVHPMYRKNNNPLLEHLISNGRLKHCGKLISHRNIRSLITSLRNNVPVLYLPDRYLGRKRSIFVPFFDVQTPTTPATSRLANLLNTPVVPITQRRLPNNQGYSLVISKPLENFPSEDIVEDTTRINMIIEKLIRNDPANYLWTHRRFKKTHLEGNSLAYSN